jgi:hypothetical protein
MKNAYIRIALVGTLLILSPSCGKKPRAYSGGFSDGGMYALFDSSKEGEPVYLLNATFVPARPAGAHGTMGGSIYGSGYFAFDDGPRIEFSMSDPYTVKIGTKSANLKNGRFINLAIRSDGSITIAQEGLDSPLAKSLIPQKKKANKAEMATPRKPSDQF